MNTALYYGAKLVVFVTLLPLMIVSPRLTTNLMSRAEHAIEHRLQMSDGRPWRDGGAAHRANHAPGENAFHLDRLVERLQFPSILGLVVAWMMGLFLLVGYPFAIYMTWRFARGYRAASRGMPKGWVPDDTTDPRAEDADVVTQADETSGQGWMDMDWLFFRHLAGVMHGAGIQAEEVQRACAGHAQKLTDPDPELAMNYRMAMMEEAARQWPVEASLAFDRELNEPWAPSEKSRQGWRELPPECRRSYVRQGRVTVAAVARGFG